MSEFIQDPMFFYTITFVVFMALAFRFGRKPMLNWADTEIAKIRSELDQARKLRTDAEAMLADYKIKQRDALAQAEAIVASAKADAARLQTQAEADLKASLARQEQQATDRIRVAEADALNQVRLAAIDLAMDLARKTLASQMDGGAASKLIDQAIADLPKQAASKAEAA